METKIQLEMSEAPDIDLLVCGSCKRSFQLANILGFMKHKKFDCEDPGSVIDPNNKVLLCQACRQKFNTPWSLLKHAQNVHFLRIYLEQNYHVSNVTIQEEPKNTYVTADNSTFPSSVIENGDLLSKTIQETLAISESSTKSLTVTARATSEQITYVSPGGTAREELVKPESQEVGKKDEIGCVTETKDESKAEDDTKVDPICCDDQACGISVMPGTHESLKRCCSAVVPKKRKQHMEIKHRMNLLSRIRRQKNRSSSPASIVIDVTSDPGQVGERAQSASEDRSDESLCKVTSNTGHFPTSRMNSVIIQPGSTFSIPLSFALSTSSQSLNVARANTQPASASLASSALKLPAVSPSTFKRDSDAEKTSPTSSILQGILAQMISEKTVDIPNVTSGNVKASLTQQVVHTKEETSISSQCDGASNSQSSIGRNFNSKKRRYPTSRPYKCDKCDDAFNQRIHLKKHQSKHTGIKPFKCDQCDYATVERSHLKVHIRVHTGEKPFKCTYCEYATAQRSTLKIHLKRHHSSTDHCPQCSRKDHLQCYSTLEQTVQVLPSSSDNNAVQTTPFTSPDAIGECDNSTSSKGDHEN